MIVEWSISYGSYEVGVTRAQAGYCGPSNYLTFVLSTGSCSQRQLSVLAYWVALQQEMERSGAHFVASSAIEV